MEYFRRKVRLVSGGHMIEDPPTITFAIIVSRGTARIAPMITALNYLEVKAADILNVDVTAPVHKN